MICSGAPLWLARPRQKAVDARRELLLPYPPNRLNHFQCEVHGPSPCSFSRRPASICSAQSRLASVSDVGFGPPRCTSASASPCPSSSQPQRRQSSNPSRLQSVASRQHGQGSSQRGLRLHRLRAGCRLPRHSHGTHRGRAEPRTRRIRPERIILI